MSIHKGGRRFILTPELYGPDDYRGDAFALVQYPIGVEVNVYLRDKVSRFIGPMTWTALPLWLGAPGNTQPQNQAYATVLSWANPARNRVNRSQIRLFNPDARQRFIAFSGTDSDGMRTVPVLCRLPAFQAVMVLVDELESGVLTGRAADLCRMASGWGAGAGKWRVFLFDYLGSPANPALASRNPFVAMSILHATTAGMLSDVGESPLPLWGCFQRRGCLRPSSASAAAAQGSGLEHRLDELRLLHGDLVEQIDALM